MEEFQHVNVAIIGAGISGIGLACHLKQQCPKKSLIVLEANPTFGGTWEIHKYPGIRSDSDLYTFGYRFKPWQGKPIAEAHEIRDYLKCVIDDFQLDDNIFYNRKVVKASWSEANNHWSISWTNPLNGEAGSVTADFFVWGGGYYDPSEGYMPNWEGVDNFKGEVVHPQTWPENIDLTNKKVTVIGSGATAVTIIPNIINTADHVTMLQRSPSYFWTAENRNELAERLNDLDLPERWVHEIVRRDILRESKEVHELAAAAPDEIKAELLDNVKSFVGPELTEQHFTPSYRPWQQRLAVVPNGDLFEAINMGQVSVLTDHIDHFNAAGIALKSGAQIDSDVIITATGFNLLFLGGIEIEVDGMRVDPSGAYTYRGLMLSDIPNLLMVFGYLRTSWTMRVDLLADYLCRLLKHMDALEKTVVIPSIDPNRPMQQTFSWVSEDEFNPGYMKRGVHLMPNQGDREPWRFSPDYYVEKDLMPAYPLDDRELHYR